jgi:hypothetical protein
MKPIKFKQCNATLITSGYTDSSHDLPVHVTDEMVTVCFQFSFFEKLKLLFTNRLWVSILTDEETIYPMSFSIDRDIYYD